MGARQRAQKRTKAPKGSLKGSPASQKKSSSSLHVSNLNPAARGNALMGSQDYYATSSSPGNRNGFSMSQEARNTERHVFGWGTTKLRDQAVSFVSAGTLHQDPENIRDQKDTMKDEDIRPEQDDSSVEADVENESDHAHEQVVLEATPAESVVPSIEAGQEDSNTNGHAVSKSRSVSSSSSDSDSDSDSEQIVFLGRQTQSQKQSREVSRSRNKQSRRGNDYSSAAEKSIPVSVPAPAPAPAPALSLPIPIRSGKKAPVPTVEASSGDYRPIKSRKDRRSTKKRLEEEEEEALMQDYIANMVMDDTEEEESADQMITPAKKKGRNDHYRYYGGAGTEFEKVQLQKTTPTAPRAREFDQAMDWDSDDLEDFDDISTTDEEIEDVEQVLRHRERDSGVQYLVTAAGRSASDAKWILDEKLVSESARSEIRIFEEIMAMELGDDSFDDEDDSSTNEEEEEALNDLIDHIESEDDENAKILAHAERMTDEQIARALAKQEELGMGSDELLLFGGDVGEDESDVAVDMDAFGRNDDFVSFSARKHTSNRTRSKRNKKGRDSFPSAAAFADALDQDPYGAFDVMDFDRPSLRPRKKGRKSGPLYDEELGGLEDEELRDQLLNTWAKDREKKAARKRDKEEERQAFLIDASERGSPMAIKAEIRQFLVQEVDTLRLAPMDASVRASVHRIAKALKLNSRSEGKEGHGVGRYPVLTKTARTPSYTIETIWEIDALMNTRKFFPKHAGSYKANKMPRATTSARMRRSGGGISGASYMNGEVVGASAPELSADNRGRALLEKMGWSTGMALGAEGNKGSVDSIKHVVKTNKAGLG